MDFYIERDKWLCNIAYVCNNFDITARNIIMGFYFLQ
jgi:hypothetical protein